MKNFRRNEKGLLMYFVVVIMALIIVGAMWFFLAVGIQAVEEAFNPLFDSSNFASEANYNSFDLATVFVNYIILFFLVFLVLGLIYYGYNESQRRR